MENLKGMMVVAVMVAVVAVVAVVAAAWVRVGS
jgi:hypothetical protein